MYVPLIVASIQVPADSAPQANAATAIVAQSLYGASAAELEPADPAALVAQMLLATAADDLQPTNAPAVPADSTPPAATVPAPAATPPSDLDESAEVQPAKDPLEGFNRASFKVSMAVTKVVVGPVAT